MTKRVEGHLEMFGEVVFFFDGHTSEEVGTGMGNSIK